VRKSVAFYVHGDDLEQLQTLSRIAEGISLGAMQAA
jgi:hypothetical protein